VRKRVYLLEVFGGVVKVVTNLLPIWVMHSTLHLMRTIRGEEDFGVSAYVTWEVGKNKDERYRDELCGKERAIE
jgi:hypothetical protein